jgi:hypothetical protein
MATDDGDSPANTTKPKSSTTGGASKKDSNAPSPLVAPPFLSVDRTDPLMPDQLRRHEFTIEQTLHAYHTITRIARHPEQDASWPLIIAALREAEREYGELNIVARAQYEKQRRFRDLTSRLDMGQLENIRAADEAEATLQNSWLVWRRVFSTYVQILQALRPNKPLPSEIMIPPPQPDPWPSPGTMG